MFGLILSDLTGTHTSLNSTGEEEIPQVAYVERMPAGEPIQPVSRYTEFKSVSLSADRPTKSYLIRDEKEVEIVKSELVAPNDSRNVNQIVDSRLNRLENKTAQLPTAQKSLQNSKNSTYVVRENDSLIKIASRVYGRARSNEYKRIFQANRDKLSNEHSLMVGQKLVIPALEKSGTPTRHLLAARSAGPKKNYQELTLDQLSQHFGQEKSNKTTAQKSRRVYVVRQGDNLTKIARKVLKDDSHNAIMKIYQSNKDKLSDPDSLQVGMELEIPI